MKESELPTQNSSNIRVVTQAVVTASTPLHFILISQVRVQDRSNMTRIDQVLTHLIDMLAKEGF